MTTCSGPDCDRPARRGGLCWGHVKQRQRKRRLLAIRRRRLDPWERLFEAVLVYLELRASDHAAWVRARARLRQSAIAYAQKMKRTKRVT